MRAAARVDREGESGLLVLDLGAHKALALSLVGSSERPAVRGWAERACALQSQGMLVDLEAATSVFGEVLGAASRQAGLASRRVVIGVGGGQVRCVPAQGSVRSKLPVVLQEAHLDRALDAAADIGLPSDHEVLHVLPSAYRVDGARVVRSPLGMRARQVTVDTVVVTVRSQVLDTLQRALESCGYELVGAAAEPLAAARAALSADDRRRGAVLVDIGGDCTAAVAYRDGVVRGLAWVPAGGSHVTRDIAFALQLDVAHAEALKRRAGHALVEGVAPERQVEVRRGRERLGVGQQMLAGIVEERMDELLGLARDGLRAQSALGVGDRIVLAGGGARLRGAVDLAEQVFASPARLATPAESWGWREAAGDPACCTALGLVEYAVRSGLLRDEPPAPWTRALAGLRRVVGDRREGVRGALRLGRPRGDRSDTSVHA